MRDIEIPTLVGQFDRVAPCERVEIVGQAVGGGHFGPFDEHRNDAHVTALERRGDLQTGEIAGIVEPTIAIAVLRVDPARTDHRKQHTTGLERALDGVDEIDTGFDRLHITEYRHTVEVLLEMIGETTGRALAILSTITDKNPLHGAASDTAC